MGFLLVTSIVLGHSMKRETRRGHLIILVRNKGGFGWMYSMNHYCCLVARLDDPWREIWGLLLYFIPALKQ